MASAELELTSVFPRAAAPAARRVRTPGLLTSLPPLLSSLVGSSGDAKSAEDGRNAAAKESLDVGDRAASRGERVDIEAVLEEHDAAEPEAVRACSSIAMTLVSERKQILLLSASMRRRQESSDRRKIVSNFVFVVAKKKKTLIALCEPSQGRSRPTAVLAEKCPLSLARTQNQILS